MITLILRRIVQSFPVLIGVTIVVFLMIHLIPGDPASVIAGDGASPERISQIREKLSLDRPLPIQYMEYMKRVFHGDLGESVFTNRPVIDEVLTRLPITVQLALASVVIKIVIGMLAGIISATKHNTWIDMLVMIGTLLGISLPRFWVGMMLIYFFSVKFHLFPVAGWGTWKHMILPAFSLGIAGASIVARMTRASMLEVIRQDYIRTARAKGLSERVIIYKHALKNAIIPVITVVGLQFGVTLAGSVLTESVFAINGLGRLIIDSIRTRDFPMVQGTVLFVSVIFMLVNMIIDILYKVSNKRIEVG